MPGLAVLSAAADVGHGQDPPEVPHEDEARDAVARRDGDVEAAVAVQEARVGAVQFDALLVHDEHGDLSAVLGGVEDLKGEEKTKQNQTWVINTARQMGAVRSFNLGAEQ